MIRSINFVCHNVVMFTVLYALYGVLELHKYLPTAVADETTQNRRALVVLLYNFNFNYNISNLGRYD